MVRVPEAQSERCYFQILIQYSSVSSRPQCRSQAVVCVSTPRKYPLRGYFLVNIESICKDDFSLNIFKSRTVREPSRNSYNFFTIYSYSAFLPKKIVAYRTRANKGRAHYSKILVLALRLSHKKRIKNVLQHDFLGGQPLIESDRYWREYGRYVFQKVVCVIF